MGYAAGFFVQKTSRIPHFLLTSGGIAMVCAGSLCPGEIGHSYFLLIFILFVQEYIKWRKICFLFLS
jgi:hypothetical protein